MDGVRIAAPGDFGRTCLDALLVAVEGIARPVVGLPTGNTPVALYEALDAAVRNGRADVSSWRPFAIDEYGGPRSHPCSNRAFFARYWDVIPGAQPVEQFDPEASDTTADCRRMDESVVRAGGLEVALLGIGMNGHLAFNEPGSTPASQTRRVDLHQSSILSSAHCWGEESPHWGVTLGLDRLLAARTVIVMANGEAKAAIVAAALRGPRTPDCPVSFVRDAARPVWVLDEAAASLLGG